MPFVPEIAQADFSAPFNQCDLSPTIKRAVIAWRGQLTPDFQYLERFLSPPSTDEHTTHDHAKKETEKI